MNYIQYAKSWIKRPLFNGLKKDLIVLETLISEIESLISVFDKPIAWAKINDNGDLYDLRLHYNPYENNLIPLYMRPNDYEQRKQIMQSKGEA